MTDRPTRDNITVSVVNNDNATGYATGTGDIHVTDRPPRPAAAHPPAPGAARPGSPEPGERYDVCLSFAGEQRSYVEEVAAVLAERGIAFFYDAYEVVQLWGKDLYQHLAKVYGEDSRYCVVFASADYARKVWTSHELRSAQARALDEDVEYILPARFDDTRIPGLPPTTAYIDLRTMTPTEFAELIVRKVRPGPRLP